MKRNNSQVSWQYLGLIFLFLLVASCAPGPNTSMNIAPADGSVAGFWLGGWHGIIAPLTFIVSLFDNSVSVYEVYNNGGWYNFGFMLGISISLGGSGRASRRSKK